MSGLSPRPIPPLAARAPQAMGGTRPLPGNRPTSACPDGPAEGISGDLDATRRRIARTLGAGVSFDMVVRDLRVGDREALLVVVDGFIDDDVLVRILGSLKEIVPGPDPIEAAAGAIPHPEVQRERCWREVVTFILSGAAVLFIDGAAEAIVIDSRTYPAREPSEPDLEKVMRGPRDGFTETLVFNTALMRRRLRDPGLRVELQRVGRRSATDVAILYINDIANPATVARIRDRIARIDTDGLLMADRSLEEYILDRHDWWNPFPLLHHTERPDTAAVHLLEGGIVISCDTSPVHILLPATFFHHLQHAEEFHSDVLVGTFVRGTRMVALFLAWLGPPLWVALALSRNALPQWLRFIGPRETTVVPLFLQFIFGEIGVELIRLGLIHTPAALATSLGIIGAILLGDLAVRVGLFNAEVILYVTLSALGAFAIPSQELRMAVRVWRVVLLVGAGVGRLIGLGVLLAVNVVALALTRSFDVPYLWPLVPLNARALLGVIVRRPVPTDTVRPRVLRPIDPDRH